MAGSAKKAKVVKVKPVKLKLTAEQLKQLENAFGPEFAKRVKALEIEQIAGFLRSNVKVN
ncbi:hypothetical protein X994_2780 [Burkholderia pseudomallei]|uniref:hypothetical protein n=1 Tax=Burkholderia pseudomallei TaxID=28450 RepID=UPI00052AF6F4|nr:hypothetical protein [Burkholderia pseudomallei]AIV78392.1 hypothetical protein X994_2780 [Burkholderia pseudomallei]